MKKLLVVVDYQNDFVIGALGFPQAIALEPFICAKIDKARQEGSDVVFTFDTHGADYLDTLEGKYLPVAHCFEESPGWQLYGRVVQKVTPQDTLLRKSSFGSEKLMKFVHDKGYDTVELCGVVSNICVLSNAVLVKTALPQAEVIVDARCVAAPDEEVNQKALDVMEGLQIQVIGRENKRGESNED